MKMMKSLISLVAISLLIQFAAATQYTVGAPSGAWDYLTDLKAWAATHEFVVGDSLVFLYAPNHDVLEVVKADYETCNPSNPIAVYAGGFTTITLTSVGKHYYICGVVAHCEQGMKLEIEVVASAATPPPPSRVAPPPPTTPSTRPPSTTPTAPSPVQEPIPAPPTTEAPWAAEPISAPVWAPTQSPDYSPSVAPTTSPTPSPSKSPAKSPSKAPVSSPSKAPVSSVAPATPPSGISAPALPPTSAATKISAMGLGVAIMMLLTL